MIDDTPPDTLTTLQKKLWTSLVPLVELEDVDILLFQQAIVSASYMLEAQKLIKKEGLFTDRDILNTRTGVVTTLKVEHPALKLSERHQKLFLAMVDKLGWSPAARAKIKMPQPQKEQEVLDDPFTTPPPALESGTTKDDGADTKS